MKTAKFIFNLVALVGYAVLIYVVVAAMFISTGTSLFMHQVVNWPLGAIIALALSAIIAVLHLGANLEKIVWTGKKSFNVASFICTVGVFYGFIGWATVGSIYQPDLYKDFLKYPTVSIILLVIMSFIFTIRMIIFIEGWDFYKSKSSAQKAH
jgi:hypothetical protein